MAKVLAIPETEERFWERVKEMALLGQDPSLMEDVAHALFEGDESVDAVAAMLAAGGEEIRAVRGTLASFLSNLAGALHDWVVLRSGRGPDVRAVLEALLCNGWMKPWLGEDGRNG